MRMPVPPERPATRCNKLSKIDQYPRPDLNRHALRQQILSLRCLPFHHVGEAPGYFTASRRANRISDRDVACGAGSRPHEPVRRTTSHPLGGER